MGRIRMLESGSFPPQNAGSQPAPPGPGRPAGEPGAGGAESAGSGGEAAAEVGPAPAPRELQPEVERLKDRWLRAEAELQNFRRRATREWEEGRRAAEEAVLLELVAVADDLERALQGLPDSEQAAAWSGGVELVLRRIRDYLRRQGVEVVDPLGSAFDPGLHEALLEVDASERFAPGTVAEVVLKGYRRGDRALRPARVVVARPPASRPDPGESEGSHGQG